MGGNSKRTVAPERPIPPDDNSTYIPLTRGKFALVDKADFEWLGLYNWQALPSGETFYAKRGIHAKLMHREIMNAPAGMEVDHINNDGLDNRRTNLRLLTRPQNLRNRRIFRTNKSGFKGVVYDGHNRKWKATINLGTFDSAEEAARAYDDAIKKLFGAFAKPNLDEEF